MSKPLENNAENNALLYCQVFNSPFGKVVVAEQNNALIFLGFADEAVKDQRIVSAEHRSTPFLQQVADVLDAYWQGQDQLTTIPLANQGTAFQQQVWQAFPTKSVYTYSELAMKVGKPQAARAVASACAQNPISIFRPCHRIVGKNGSMRGYAWGTEVKEKLLAFEQDVYA